MIKEIPKKWTFELDQYLTTVFGVPTQSLGVSKDKATLLPQSFVIQKMSSEGWTCLGGMFGVVQSRATGAARSLKHSPLRSADDAIDGAINATLKTA